MTDFYNFIEAYHQNQLNPRQREAFEKAMASDEHLREAVANYTKIIPVLDLLLENELRGKMATIKESYEQRRRRLMWIKVAASVALLLGVLFFLLPKHHPTNEELFTQFYIAPLPVGNRGMGDTSHWQTDSIYMAAHQDIAAHQFRDAHIKFQNLLGSHKKEEAEWFIALLHLRSDQIDSSRLVLENIRQDTKHLYSEKAGQLIKNLP